VDSPLMPSNSKNISTAMIVLLQKIYTKNESLLCERT
jgi:hypothetical protein